MRAKLRSKQSGKRSRASRQIPQSIEERTIAALSALPEAVFTSRVVVPLLRAMDSQARIEETHGANEAGRDLVWFTRHAYLSRQKIICIQVKSHRISVGSTSGPYSLTTLANQVQTAKISGVCVLDGSKVYPEEVWIVNSHPFPEPQRRVTQDILARIQSFGGTLIDGVELTGLLIKHASDLIAELTRLAAPNLVRAIAAFSAHRESRAFGLRIDRSIEDFHVAARACPSTGQTSMLMSGKMKFHRYEVDLVWSTSGREADRLKLSGTGIDPGDILRDSELAELAPFVDEFNVPAGWRTGIEREATAAIIRTYKILPVLHQV